jgi:hypothetical protein
MDGWGIGQLLQQAKRTHQPAFEKISVVARPGSILYHISTQQYRTFTNPSPCKLTGLKPDLTLVTGKGETRPLPRMPHDFIISYGGSIYVREFRVGAEAEPVDFTHKFDYKCPN